MEKLTRVWFFQKTFLLANIGLEAVLGMFFLTFSIADIWFTRPKFVWKTYIAVEALLTNKQVKINRKKEFAVAIGRRQRDFYSIYSSSNKAKNYSNLSFLWNSSYLASKYRNFYQIFQFLRYIFIRLCNRATWVHQN